MLEPLFGNKNIEKIFFFLIINKKCYGTQLSRIFDQALSPFQNSLDRLESGGILVSFLEGRVRNYQFNPRYPFLKELLKLIEKAYQFLPEELKHEYYEHRERRRPRKKGKPL